MRRDSRVQAWRIQRYPLGLINSRKKRRVAQRFQIHGLAVVTGTLLLGTWAVLFLLRAVDYGSSAIELVFLLIAETTTGCSRRRRPVGGDQPSARTPATD